MRRVRDQLDRQVISELAHDPQVSNRELASRLGVSESTISLRIDSLIENRLIRPSVQQNIVNAGFDTFGWLEVRCQHAHADRIAERIAQIENVFSISRFFDDPFLQVMVFASGVPEFRELLATIGKIEGIDAIEADLAIGDVCIKSGIAAL